MNVKKNALTEWLAQTKKLSKAKDYICLEVVDNVMEVLWFLDKKMVLRRRKFFDRLCEQYHKPNPINLLKKPNELEKIFQEKHDGMTRQEYFKKILHDNPPPCIARKDWISCGMSKFGIKLLSWMTEASIGRCESSLKDLDWQWFEIIDFMYERPELINPALIDEYIESRINEVCENHKKNNPLSNGLRKRFGKYWKDEKGNWHKEKRVRF
jgi:hypothetical protein